MTSTVQASDTDGRTPERVERDRLTLQQSLDAQKTPLERNVLGQFATPPELADDIMAAALALLDRQPIRFLEPSVGSGAFYSALLRSGSADRVERATGIEVDPRFADVARSLWAEAGLDVVEADFTDYVPAADRRANLLVANPPYVRHHHLDGDTKRRLRARAASATGYLPSGLSGLYLYFTLLAHDAMEPGAVAAWLIPSEFMDVNYGNVLREYLKSSVSLLQVHRFDPADVQFDDALVTSAVVIFRNSPPTESALTRFTHGGSVSKPASVLAVAQGDLVAKHKWSRYFREDHHVSPDHEVLLGDYLKVRRGIATGAGKFFILPRREAEERGFSAANYRPILPSPRNVKGLVVEAAADGWPDLEPQLALIDCQAPLRVLEATDPALAAYLHDAPEKVRKGYLVRQREPWYRQEQRLPAPFLCTYMGRGLGEDQPVRFIRNDSRATATNMFLMLYPTPLLERYLERTPDGVQKVHEALLAITGDQLRAGGRVYGGGLHKMEPRELAQMSGALVQALAPGLLSPLEPLSLGL